MVAAAKADGRGERRPPDQVSAGRDEKPEPEDAPLPWAALLSLTFAQLASALILTSAFPIVGPMASQLLQRPIDEVGAAAGVLGASFMFGRVLTSSFWGWLSDRIGRKPVILIGTVGAVLSNLVFAVSFTYEMAVITRAVGGLVNGVVGVNKAVAGEIVSSPRNQRAAMTFLTAGWSLGLVLGPALGGLLQGVGPVGGSLPFLPPAIVVACLGVASAVAVVVFLPETRPSVGVGALCSRSGGAGGGGAEEGVELAAAGEGLGEAEEEAALAGPAGGGGGATSAAGAPAPSRAASPLDEGSGWLLCRPRVSHIVWTYTLFSCASILADEVMPLWAMAQPRHGGLGLTAGDVGIVLAGSGAVMVALQLTVCQVVMRRYSSRTLMLVGALTQIPLLLGTPVVALAAIGPGVAPTPVVPGEPQPSGDVPGVTTPWLRVPVMLAAGAFVFLRLSSAIVAFTACAVIVNASVPDHERGALNGVSMATASIGKAVGPALGGAVLAWALSSLASAWPPFVLAATMNVGVVVLVFLLPESVNKTYAMRAEEHAKAQAEGEAEPLVDEERAAGGMLPLVADAEDDDAGLQSGSE